MNIYIYIIFIYSAVDMCQNLRAKTRHLNDKSRRPNVFSACHDAGATRREQSSKPFFHEMLAG